MKVLVLGSNGTLGGELCRQLQGEELFAFDRELDVTDRAAVAAKIKELRPEIIFNCAAYNDVDKAETDAELAFKLNAEAVGHIAEAAAKVSAVLVHYSTGFIFDGEAQNGYNEEAIPNPQSVYGKSKLAGEEEAKKSPKFYIVRLNLLFGAKGDGQGSKPSFPELILDLAKSRDEFNFVSDEVSTPTYAKDLAEASIRLVKEQYPYGVYHLPNDDEASWYDYAAEVFKLKNISVKLNPISSAEMPRAAKRPKNSVLLNTKFPKLRPWREALAEFLTQN